jgi:excisionase family DNA binding protein
MRITAAARALNVHADTLRKLEREGRFKAQRDWRGHRRFSLEDITTLRAILYPSFRRRDPR